MSSILINVRLRVMQPVCPSCGSIRIRREHSLHSSAIEKSLRLCILQVPYVCDKCEHTFFDFFFQAGRARKLRMERRREQITDEGTSLSQAEDEELPESS